MKARLSLTLDEGLIDSMKKLAAQKGISVSEMVGEFFQKLAKPVKRKTVVDLVRELNKPVINPDADLKHLYYESQSKKHGF